MLGIKGTKYLLLTVACAAGTATSLAATAPPVPLPILAPFHRLFFQPPPIEASRLGAGNWQWSLALSETNVLHVASRAEAKAYDLELDYELTRFALQAAWGLSDTWTFAAELPLLSLHSGVLDRVALRFEDAIDRVKPRRQREEAGRFTYRGEVGGETFLSVPQGGLNPGDLALSARRHLCEPRGRSPGLVARAGLKLPTGDPERGTGSGEFDLMGGLAASWQLGIWSVSSGLALTLPLGDVVATPGLSPLPSLSGYGELSRPLRTALRLHLQVAASTPVFDLNEATQQAGDVADLRPVTGNVFQVTPALSWRLRPRARLFAGLVEDFESDNTAADLTLFATLRWRFDAAGRARPESIRRRLRPARAPSSASGGGLH